MSNIGSSTPTPRRYWNEYVNHMIRHYVSTPAEISVQGATTVDVTNWLCVQEIISALPAKDADIVMSIYGARMPFTEAVDRYCHDHPDTSPTEIWVVITKTGDRIARRRGLI